MNIDVRVLFGDGERAARGGDPTVARAAFMEAAQTAAEVQLWRSVMRCYRHALELDLMDREIVERMLQLPPRLISGRGWDEYRTVIDAHPAWPHFGCRGAHVRIGDLGAVVECAQVGVALELMMSDRDLVEVHPDARFSGMPIAMALVILRRALWPAPREHGPIGTMRVAFAGRQQVKLDEHGDWEPVVRSLR
jgi:hypothetical protein